MRTTPGPWMYYLENNGDVSVCTRNDDGTCGPQIATVVSETVEDPYSFQNLADASLIASAPDLRDALQWLVDDLSDVEAGIVDAMANARQVLADLRP
jgi:hypothetical protein